MMEALLKQARQYESRILSWRRSIHRYAEPGGQEFKTAALVEAEAETLGLPVIHAGEPGRIVVLDTGRPGKTILLRADMDALPVRENPRNLIRERTVLSENEGFCHACGHDAHTAMLLGAMHLLASSDSLTGRVLFCFESDEENGTGWPKMLAALEPFRVDRCHSMHVLSSLESGMLSIQDGGRMSGMVAVNAEFIGKGGHGSRPDLSVNPVFAAASALSNLAVAATNQIDPGETLTLGITSIQAGSVFNVIPDRARVLGTMRYFRHEIGLQALQMLKSVFDHTAAMYGCTVEYDPQTRIYVEPVVNDPACAALVRSVIPAQWLTECDKWYASEPFSAYMKRWPGCMAFLGVRNEALGCAAEHHNEHFDLDEAALWKGTYYYAACALAD